MAETQEKIKVTQEKLPSSQVGLDIEVSPEMSQKAYEQVITQFMRSAQIPGFRKGKVPRQVVLQRFGTSRIKAAAVEELIQNTLEKAIKQEQISALGNFQLRSSFDELVDQFQPGEALTFSAAVDVPPEVELGQYVDLHVQAQETPYDPAQVDTLLQEHQNERATLIPVENRSAQQGDTVLIDFSGRLVPETEAEAGELIEGGQASDFQLELEEGRFIPGFVDGVIGMNIGETKDLALTFPEEYFQEDLAGKNTIFEVTLKEIKEKELPELDDDFAQDISEFKTLAELRTFLEERYQQEAQQKTEASKEAALLEELLKSLQVEIPETLIVNEVNYLITQTASRLQSQGIDVNKLITQDVLPEMRERMRPEAVTRIKRSLTLAEIAKRESIEVESAEIDTRVKSLMEQFSDRDVDQARLKEVVHEDLLEEKVLQWLKDHSHIDLVEASEIVPDPEALTEELVADSIEAESDATDVTVPVTAETVTDTEAVQE